MYIYIYIHIRTYIHIVQGIYQSPSTQLLIMLNQMSYSVKRFNHRAVTFMPLATAMFTLDPRLIKR